MQDIDHTPASADRNLPTRAEAGLVRAGDAAGALRHPFSVSKSPLWEVGGSLKRDEIGLNHHRALASCLSMIFSENRYTLFRIML